MTKSNSQVTIMWLNSWANRCKEEILTYVKEHTKKKVDIFFFTEVTRMKRRKDKVVTAQVGHSENEPPMQLNSSSQLIEVLKDNYFCRYISAKSSSFECSDSGIKFDQVGFGSLMAVRNHLGYTLFGDTKIHNDGDVVRPRVLQWVILRRLEFGIWRLTSMEFG